MYYGTVPQHLESLSCFPFYEKFLLPRIDPKISEVFRLYVHIPTHFYPQDKEKIAKVPVRGFSKTSVFEGAVLANMEMT